MLELHEVLAHSFVKGGWKIVDALVNLIVGTSTTLDVYVIVRLIVVMIALELFATACGFLGGMK